ncbi:MAG TPA: DUF4837 family protein [archaeon]|nr:DUF4837 family protein [archaeon]
MGAFPYLRYLLILTFFFSSLTLSGCGDYKIEKPRAFGREKEILVICENNIWAAIENDLRKKVEVPIHAVRWEPIFEISQVEEKLVSHYKEWDKIILIESLENMKLLPQVVDEATLKKIGEGQGLFFSNIDIWARGQRVAGLAAAKDDQLHPLVKFYGSRIFKDFLHQLEEQEKVRMFSSGINKNLSDSLLQCCGFSFTLPNVYERTLQDSLPENKLLFTHQDPVRSIFIGWSDSPPIITDYSQESLAGMRDQMLADIYPGNFTLPERVDTSTVISGGLSRLRVYGVWENRKEISGGIYISQIIESPYDKRRYYIDCLLFCPDARLNKYRFIFQLDRIMNSFSLAQKDSTAAPDQKL